MAIRRVEVGAPVTLEVAKMEEVEGQFGLQLKFTAPGGDCLFVGRDAGLRQLERIGLTDDPSGAVLLFEKVQKGAKTYLNINQAKPSNGNGGKGPTHTAPPAAKAAAAAPAPAPAGGVTFSDPLYLAITEFVLNDVQQAYLRRKEPTWLGADQAAAIAATLYIQAKRS